MTGKRGRVYSPWCDVRLAGSRRVAGSLIDGDTGKAFPTSFQSLSEGGFSAMFSTRLNHVAPVRLTVVLLVVGAAGWSLRRSPGQSLAQDRATAATQQKPKLPAEDHPADKDTAKLKALLKERIETLRQRRKRLYEAHMSGQGAGPGAVLHASNDVLLAELDLHESPSERIPVYEKLVENMKKLEQQAEMDSRLPRAPGGKFRHGDYLMAKAKRLEAEIWLQRERIKAKASAK